MRRRDSTTLELFDAAPMPKSPGALAGLKTQIAHQMSAVIRDCGIDRYEIAAKMSALLGEEVSKAMVDAYTAESREDQNIPAYRLLAFIAATEGFDALDQLLHRVGCGLTVGHERQAAALVRLEAKRTALDKEIKLARKRLQERAHD